MKIILSRKGFDFGNGHIPSPILPDGTLLSLPIQPENDNDNHKYSDLCYNKKSYLDIIKELKPTTKLNKNSTCHLDPDIRQNAIERGKGWAPLFGQANKAQSHLVKHGVTKGDLFLFFGWFKKTEIRDTKYGFIKDPQNWTEKDMHIIFGYLQVGEIFNDMKGLPQCFNYHPHAQIKSSINCLYKASKYLSFLPSYRGAGCLKYHQDLILTKPGCTRSKWNLPAFFKNVNITYHDSDSFKKDYFQSTARGQEFVIEANEEIISWAKKIIMHGNGTDVK